MYVRRLGLFLLISLALHLALAHGAARMPALAAPAQVVMIQVVQAPPEPPPPPPEPPPQPPEPKPLPEAPPPPLKDVVHEAPTREPRPRPKQLVPAPQRQLDRKDVPQSERPAQPGQEATDTPVFGASLESTSQQGAGPAVPVGNTLQTEPGEKAPSPDKPKPLAAPAPVHEVTEMPVMKGQCRGEYTEDARRAGVEGVVVLDLIVGLDGRTREIKVVQRLGHGLDEAAIEALRSCAFKPGRRGQEAVAVRLRTFKVRFFLDDD